MRQICMQMSGLMKGFRSDLLDARTVCLAFRPSCRSKHSALARPGASAQQAVSVARRDLLTDTLAAAVLLTPMSSLAAEQGIQPSDFTVPALSSSAYRDKILETRSKAWKLMEGLVEDNKYPDLSNNLVLAPIDDIRQSVLYIPSALLKEGKRQEAIGSRKAYTDYLRELKRLDELAQKATRFEADEEDVKDSLERLSKRLDGVLQYVK